MTKYTVEIAEIAEANKVTRTKKEFSSLVAAKAAAKKLTSEVYTGSIAYVYKADKLVAIKFSDESRLRKIGSFEDFLRSL